MISFFTEDEDVLVVLLVVDPFISSSRRCKHRNNCGIVQRRVGIMIGWWHGDYVFGSTRGGGSIDWRINDIIHNYLDLLLFKVMCFE